MPALPALLLSITVLLTPARCSPGPAHTLAAVRMAAILDERTACGRGERMALALARENINRLLEDAARGRVEVDVYDLPQDSQYHTTETMCQILPKGVVSVIGPASSPASVSTVSHICGEKEETPRLPFLRFSSLTLYPSNEDLSLAIAAVLRLLRLEELVRRFLISRETLSVRMLDDSQDPTPLLKEIRDDKVATIIIDANASTSYHILRKASELGMTSSFYKYILTTMEVVEEQASVVGFSMLNSSHPFYLEFLRSLSLSWRDSCSSTNYPGPALSAALLFDAVHVVVAAVQELNRSQDIGVRPLSCTSPLIWQHGTSLMNYLRMVEFEGLTGRVEFNSKGQRTNYTLKILEKHPEGHKEIGVWYSNNTLVMNSTSLDLNTSESLVNKTLTVTTILENPYVMRKANHQDLQGNDQYEGFCVDMLRELADILKFSFRIKLVDDGLYGAPEPNGSWTGMVGELIHRREKVIDFSKPFMSLGISILYRVHLGRKPGYFSFLDPFSPAVWLFMLLALSPYEWYNPHPCLRDRRDLLENQYTLGNSLWFPIGGFMQQGSEIMPRALWAFTLIIISSYTANLAAFLTVQRMEVPIESPDDLADQTNIQYGTIHGGSTMTFFMRMWNFMHSKQPSVFVKSTEEGIARVVNSKYAFLMESTMNEYYRGLNCNLTQIGGLLDTKGYGIGMTLGSPYRDEITLAVLQLQETNRLEILKRKWWEAGQCPKEEDHRAKGLGMENIGGIFVVLICGLILSVFVAVMEFVWSTRRSDEVSVCQEMMSEFRNAVSCRKSSRSRRRRTLGSSAGGGVLRPRPRPRPLRLVRDVRFSNGQLCGLGAGFGPPGAGFGPPGAGLRDPGPGPHRLLGEDPLGADVGAPAPLPPPPPLAPPPAAKPLLPMMSAPPPLFAPPPLAARICQECRRIQALRPCHAPHPSSSSLTPLALSPRQHHHHHHHHHQHQQQLLLHPPHHHYHHGSMSLPRLPTHLPPHPPPSDRADSDGGGGGGGGGEGEGEESG
ncbi:hypothetical protein NHX12_024160 [Muraenolepis orangiensis]|uniref:Glutamate receptor ionotropic, kainate 5 n=1 Tax=Muraenolepis orangiensis TaxID=630683 RepID=A0A9Q0EM69_9TELE|nr:hypothetical protein NHX12_024160 [Muraenolepis orangiensis]